MEPDLALGRRLYEAMERLDPSSPEDAAWEKLTDRERDFYRHCVRALLAERTLILAALA